MCKTNSFLKSPSIEKNLVLCPIIFKVCWPVNSCLFFFFLLWFPASPGFLITLVDDIPPSMHSSLPFFTLTLVRAPFAANARYTARKEFLRSQSQEGWASPREEWEPGLRTWLLFLFFSLKLPSLLGFTVFHDRVPFFMWWGRWLPATPGLYPPNSPCKCTVENYPSSSNWENSGEGLWPTWGQEPCFSPCVCREMAL